MSPRLEIDSANDESPKRWSIADRARRLARDYSRGWLQQLPIVAFLLFASGPWASVGVSAAAFPVKASANGRYLVDQNGTPFPIMGRTAWFVVSLSTTDYHTFIQDCVARGYDAIELHVLDHDPRGNHPPLNGNGDWPFLNRLDGTVWNGSLSGVAPNFTTPNEAYWSFVDTFLSYCEANGILVFLFPAYVGYSGGDQGWMKEMVANGTTNMQSYGAWIATRYKNQKNLVWMMGGDMGTGSNLFDSTQTAIENALITGLKSVSGQQSTFFSAEWSRRSIATDQTTFGTAMTLNGVYSSSDDANSLSLRAYGYSPIKPVFLLEEPYDQEGSDGTGWNLNATQPVRRFQWWGWLSGIGGYISGNGYVWPFVAPAWQAHLDTQGSRDMARLNAFMSSIAWYNLVPSGLAGMRTLVTAGNAGVSLSAYVAATAAPNGTLLVAYIPPDHSGAITIDMGAMGSPARARWFDPTSGAYTTIGTGLANSGSRSFTPPGNNSAGAGDWVLVIDTTTSAPTISNIANQSTTVNTSTPPIPFTITDSDTPLNNLTLSAASSNPTLVPPGNVTFGGSGGSRTVTLTPANNQTGTATITVTVSDGTNSASNAFVLTVSQVNTAPTITSIADQVINEDTPTGAIGFTVGDAETAAGSLAVTGSSSNPALVPNGNIVFGGSGANRTVTISPATNQNGTATITINVSDGSLTSSANFALTVTAVNDPPTITSIGDQTIGAGGTTGPLSFTIGDVETAATSLTVSGSSSDPTLVPNGNIAFGGSGANRTVTVTGAAGQTGSATITVTVSDGQAAVSTAFTVTASAVANGLVAAYAFNEGSGSSVADASGNGNNGTTSGTSWSSIGKYGSALAFSGTSARVTIADAAILHLTTGMTLEAWVNPTTVSAAWRDVIFKGNDNYYIMGTTSTGSGKPAVGATYGGTDVNLYGPSLLAVNAWSHLAGTYDGATVRLYVNGVQVASQAQTGSLLTSSNPLQIGGDSIFGQTFQGMIDEVRVYNRALSAAEIQSDLNTPIGTAASPNTAPTISSIASQTVNEDTPTAAIGFTVGDAETAAGSLTVSGSSSNPALVPNGNIIFGGSGANRTVTLSPATNQNGTATITINVSDGSLTSSANFALTVTAVNDPPSISALASQTIGAGGTAGPLSFTIGDVETPAANLTVSGSSSNPTLVPNGNIVFGGSGANRTVTVTGAAGQSGSATITINASDGTNIVSAGFLLTVTGSFIGARSFTNASAVVIPSVGNAAPYPSAINVSGMGGTVNKVSVTLSNINHTRPDDLDILLVGPAGQSVVLMSDSGGSRSINNVSLTFSDAASASLSSSGQITTGTYKPTDHNPSDTFTAPAPAGSYGSTLSVFNGQTPNGAWSLYIVDDTSANQGNVANGWSLTLTTQGTGFAAAATGPPIPTLRIISQGNGGERTLWINGIAGQRYGIEASEDLFTWGSLGFVTGSNGATAFVDSEAPEHPQRFYRLVEVQ